MPPLLAISGFADSGKTTLVAKLTAELTGRGYRIGVVKHHGHRDPAKPPDPSKSINPPTKDSAKHLAAGAVAVAVCEPGQSAVYRLQPGDPGPLRAAADLGPVDLVLAEGYKRWPGWKLEVVAPEREPALGGDPYLLGSVGVRNPGGVRFFDRDDIRGLTELLINCFLVPDRIGPAPDREECSALWARYEMLPNIMVHSLVVAEVARRLAGSLVRAGHDLDLPLVESGALLHDIAKTECLGRKCDHARRGFEILTGLGLPGPARVLADHIDPERARTGNGLVSPSVVVNYADKRVLHDRVVTFEERGRDLLERYGIAPEHRARLKKMIDYNTGLEAELFAKMDLDPEDLAEVNDLFPRMG